MEKIFISYRRAESGFVVGRIYDKLCDEYGKDFVFKDIESLQLGMDFRDQISEKLKSCNVLLAVINSNWLNLKDETGNIRIHNQDDWVRIEIEEALRRNIPVIPILIDSTKPLEEKSLPDSLKALTFRQSKNLRPDPDFNNDMKDIITHINNIDSINLINKQDNFQKKEGTNYISYTLLTITLIISFFLIYDKFIISPLKKDTENSENHTNNKIGIPRTIHVQYFNDSSKITISKLRNNLQKQGFKSFGAEKIDYEFKNMVKYFSPDDINDAEKILKHTKKFFNDKGCPINVIELIPAESKQNNQPLELWLNHTCN